MHRRAARPALSLGNVCSKYTSLWHRGTNREEQIECLRQLGCDYLQGLLLSRPVKAEAIQFLVEHVHPIFAKLPVSSAPDSLSTEMEVTVTMLRRRRNAREPLNKPFKGDLHLQKRNRTSKAIDNLTKAMKATGAIRPRVGGFSYLAEVLQRTGGGPSNCTPWPYQFFADLGVRSRTPNR